MKIVWYGHSAFRVEIAGATILFDPFLSGNPTWDGGWEGPAEGATHVLLTHGHDDHIGDTVAIAKATGAEVVAAYELALHCASQGVEKVNPGNHGGTVDCGAFTVSFVNALHSSASQTEHGFAYLGNPLGLIVTPKDGDKVLYHMGDTGIFGDMALINELYAPQVGIVPVGDRFTMGGKQAALACKRFFNFETVIPCHYGTFPILDQTPDVFAQEMGTSPTAVALPQRGEPLPL